jgi:hypothetical protein
MPTEKRTRVEIFFPMQSDIDVYEVAIEWFAEESALTRGGATVTTPFTGLFASSTSVDLVSDSIRILFCDFDTDPTNRLELNQLIAYLQEIKSGLMRILREEEVWIVMHPIDRIVS